MYYEGKNVETNFEKALKYHQKACDGNSQLCSDIEQFYFNTKRLSASKEFYEQACNTSGLGCEEISDMYYEGKIVEQDFDKALSYRKKACNLYQRCSDSGEFYFKKKKYNEAKYFIGKILWK